MLCRVIKLLVLYKLIGYIASVQGNSIGCVAMPHVTKAVIRYLGAYTEFCLFCHVGMLTVGV